MSKSKLILRSCLSDSLIMRVFTRLREILATHQGLEKKFAEYDKQFKIVFDVLKRLMERPKEFLVEPKLKHQIGFKTKK